jgi:hypothetical protein
LRGRYCPNFHTQSQENRTPKHTTAATTTEESPATNATMNNEYVKKYTAMGDGFMKDYPTLCFYGTIKGLAALVLSFLQSYIRTAGVAALGSARWIPSLLP